MKKVFLKISIIHMDRHGPARISLRAKLLDVYNTSKLIRRNSFHNNMNFDIKTCKSIALNDTVNPWYFYQFLNTPSTAYYCLQPSSPLPPTPSLSDTPLPSCVTTPTRTECSFALFTYKQAFRCSDIFVRTGFGFQT